MIPTTNPSAGPGEAQRCAHMSRSAVVRWSALALVVVCVAVALLLVPLGRGDSTPPSQQDESDRFPARVAPVVLPMGNRVLVYGGAPIAAQLDDAELLNDAALVDPVDRSTEVTQSPPFSRGLQPPPVGVASDDDAIVVGVVCAELIPDGLGECVPGTYEAARFSGADGQWREVDLPTELASVENGWRDAVGVVADGRFVFRLGEVQDSLSGELWAYTPSDGTWERLDGPPGPVEQACVVAARFIVVPGSPAFETGDSSFEDQVSDRTAPYLWILDTASAEAGWQQTRQAPVSGHDISTPEATCLSDSVVVDNGVGRGLARLTIDSEGGVGSWATLPDPPSGVYIDLLPLDDDLLLLDASGAELGGANSQVYTFEGRRYYPAFDDEPPFMTKPAVVGRRVVGWADVGSATSVSTNSTLVSEVVREG